MNNSNLEVKICESCGKDFSCGAEAEKCWCYEVELNAETLARLRKDFKSCLCKDCLENRSSRLSASIVRG